MKILVITNNIKQHIEDDIYKMIGYIADETKKRGHEITIEEDVMHITDGAIPLSFTFFAEKAGKKLYGTTGTKEKLRPLVPEGKYNVVVFAHEAENTYEDGLLTSWTFWEGLYPETEYVELLVNKTNDKSGWVWKSLIHEMLHALCRIAVKKKFPVADEMDFTFYQGKIVPYAYNDDPYHPDGNHAHTLNNLAPFLAKLDQKGWRYFKEKEVTGLKHDLVSLLDEARHKANVPFVLTSTVRTIAHNEDVGGVPDSSHTKGLAADIRCTDSSSRFKILKALLDVGFTRLGIYKTHIHADINASKAQGVVWYL